MVSEFEPVTREIATLIEEWESKLSELSNEVITERRNSQNRNIKQILGHLIDSASNNIHRYVHLQYRESPLEFPNYASEGNNDRWIAIQSYQTEEWVKMIRLWIYINYHLIHVIRHINPDKLDNVWIAGPGRQISLKDMVIDYLRHLKLHLSEITDLMPGE
jgi:hypothetical protein